VAKTTISIIKCDVGSIAGHHVVPQELLDACRDVLARGRDEGTIVDFYVTNCGDDIELIMSHRRGEEDSKVHELAWEAFKAAAERAKEMHLYGAGQDILKTAFAGTVKGMGPGVAELEFEERPSEPIVVLMADKSSVGAWNMPLFRIFADPFCTAGLVIDPAMHDGFRFRVMDVIEGTYVELNCPEEMYDLLALIGDPHRYVIERVFRKRDGLPCAVTSTTVLSLIAGKYVGKDDPVALIRIQHGLPALGEVLEAFSFPHLVPGWMRGSHYGPLMPVSQRDAKCTRFDGPPRVVALGFQVRDATLIGPVDLFDDPAFDYARAIANQIANYMRAHGPFEPHRLPPDQLEYTTLPQLLERLKPRFKKLGK